jgi:hypothetical protein
MARRLYFCDDKGCVWREQVYQDSDLVLTSMGEKQADQLQGSIKAQNTIPGESGDLNGEVLYVAKHGGARGNVIRISHTPGPQGAGHTNRNIAAARTDLDIVVTFGTDAGGVMVRPTGQAVADIVNAVSDVSDFVSASAQGTGAGGAELTTFTNLGGGFDTGDYLKIPAHPPALLRINTVEVE